MKLFNILIIILMILIVSYVFFIRSGENEKLTPKTTFAQLKTIEKNIIVPGIVKPNKEIDIKSNISGIIEKIYARVGDEIKEGDPLLRIKIIGDPIEYEKLLKKFDATTAQYDHSKRLYETNKILFDKKVISRSEFDQIETNYKLSLADFESNKVELEMLNGKSTGKFSSNIIRATSDGTVLDLPAKVGGAVMSRSTYNEGTTIAKIANLKSLTFFGNVPEKDVSMLKDVDTIYLSLSAISGIQIPAILRLISPKGNQVDGTTVFDIYADVIPNKNSKTIIRAGYTANGKIIVGRVKNVISLDEKYLQFNDDTPYVEIVDNFKRIKKQNVSIGLSDGIFTQILSGIKLNDKIKLPTAQEDPKL